MKRIYLYGIAGAMDHYKVVRYSCVDGDGMTIKQNTMTACIGFRDMLEYQGVEVI